MLGIAWVLALAMGAAFAPPAAEARSRAGHGGAESEAKSGAKSGAKGSKAQPRQGKARNSAVAKGKTSQPGVAKTGTKNAGPAEKAGSVRSKLHKGDAGQASSAKGAQGKPPSGKTVGAEGDDRPLSKAEKLKQAKALSALRKLCTGKKAAKTRQCKALAVDEADQALAAAEAKMEKRCGTAAARKTAACKSFRGKSAKSSVDACGRRYGRAKKNESVARFAKRYGTTEAVVRKYNELADKTKKLKAGAKFLVAKSPHDGVVLAGGVLLTEEPAILKLRRPHLAFGKPMLVQTIRAAAAAVQGSSPQGVAIMVGDLSKDGGGCLPPHKSHRGGVDADIGFYFRGAYDPKVLADATAQTIDADRSWQFLRGLLATGRLQYAFIHYDLQPALLEAALRAGETAESAAKLIQYPRPIDQARATPIRHLDGHDDHMHVRFQCADEACELPAEAQVAIAALRLETLGGPGLDRRGKGLDRPRISRAARGQSSTLF